MRKLLINKRFPVCIFKPVNKFLTYDMTFCDKNMSLVKMTPINTNFENAEARTEFYNLLDIFLSNGLKPKVEISA